MRKGDTLRDEPFKGRTREKGTVDEEVGHTLYDVRPADGTIVKKIVFISM